MPRKRSTTAAAVPAVTLTGENLWGRLSDPAIRSLMTTRMVRAHRQAELDLIHRPKNGVYDPVTYYHVLDLVMQLAPNSEFRTAELLVALRTHKTQFVWDAPSVGRILADLSDNLEQAYGTPVIFQTKRWNGMSYYTDNHPERRAAMVRLAEDLYILAKQVIQLELAGDAPKRMDSPLLSCPSLE